ncbi:MAG: flagellar motor protein MotB [Bacteroides sp.]|nr:flagellar motor protein MotB [Bacteroides sp.]
MAKKKERSKIDPNAWMNTYSDMVTLLMCFFVLLYAASTPNEVKWQYIFQSFTSSGTYINPFVTAEDPNRVPVKDNDGNSLEPAGSDMDENDFEITNSDLPSNFNELAGWVSGAIAASEFSEDQISVSVSSSGSITIRFKDSVLFAPNSAELTAQGRRAVGMFVPALRALNEYIAKINIGGHTAAVQGFSDVNDWTLSSARACSVLGYMEWRVTVDPPKYKAEGYAQYTPIADNDTEEGRAQNRRVELVIIRNNNDRHTNATIEDILKYDYGIRQTGGNANPDNDDSVQQIISNLENKYSTTIDSSGNVLGNESGPDIQGAVTGIPDELIHPVDEEGNIITDASEVTAPPEEEVPEAEE